jgi:hypothetical protein
MQPSRGMVGCGLVMLFRTGNVGEVARPFCKLRGCPDCGPRRCARLHRKYVQMLDDWLDEHGPTPLVTFTIAPTAWPSLARKLRRADGGAGVPYQRLPLRDGTDRIITTHDLGRDVDLVADHHQLLGEVFTWSPEDVFETRRPSHAGWDLIASLTETTEKAQVSAGTVGDGAAEDKPKRELVGFVGRSYSEAVHVLDTLQLAPQEIPERDLPDDWAEAHRFQLPDQDSAKWFLLAKRLRLWLPTTKAQQREIREWQRGVRARGRSVQYPLPGIAA